MTRVVFMGTPEFAVPSLLKLSNEGYKMIAVVTQPDKPQGRHMKLTPPPVKQAALELGIRIIQPHSVRTDEFMQTITDLEPDLIVTAAYGKILPPDILNIPKACINVHASLLPKYRGAAPVQRSLFNGDSVSGVTIMLMDEGMDTGDIIAQKQTTVPLDMDAKQLTGVLSELGAELLTESLPLYLSGDVIPVRQNEDEATTIRPVIKEEGRIDWNKSVFEVHNKVRGCIPWPCAFSSLGGKRIRITRTAIPDDPANPCEICTDRAVAGTLMISPDKCRLFAKCSDGYIEILDLQLEGCKNMPAAVCAHNFADSGMLGGH